MKSFARVTKLSNIGGRADYISNPDRQEKIVAKSDPVDWEPYRRFEQANQRTAKKNNEGREIIIALPNSWAKLPKGMLASRAQRIAETAIGKSTDLQWAVHWNKAHTNLHLHVVFSERQKETTMERWDRDIYHTADGKVARCKADRARLPDGSIAPPVHRKGDLKGGFTAKDTKYKTQEWLYEMKGKVQTLMTEKWRVKFDDPQLLHEFHEGKGKDAPKIREKNEAIRATNKAYTEFKEKNPDQTYPENYFKRQALVAARNGKSLYLKYAVTMDNEIGLMTRDGTPSEVAAVKPEKKPTEKPQKPPKKSLKQRMGERERERIRVKEWAKAQAEARYGAREASTPMPEKTHFRSPEPSRPEPRKRDKDMTRDGTMSEWRSDISRMKAEDAAKAAPRHERSNAREKPSVPKNGNSGFENR